MDGGDGRKGNMHSHFAREITRRDRSVADALTAAQSKTRRCLPQKSVRGLVPNCPELIGCALSYGLEQFTNRSTAMARRKTQPKNPKLDSHPPSNMEKDPDQWVSGDEPMTGAQASYLKTLCEQAGDPDAFEENLTKAEASKRIDELKEELGLE
jgi:hypothetical protein